MIDFHCHLWIRGYLPEKFWISLARFFVEWYERRGTKKSVDEIEKEVFTYYWDPNGERTLTSMDEAGIEMAILLPLDLGFAIGAVAVPIDVQNAQIARIAATHPDRFIPFLGIDPRRKGAMDLLRRGVDECGIRGIKYYGIGGFFPKEGLSLLEYAAKKNLILLIHQGPFIEPFESKYSHPRHLESVLKSFPSLRVVASHMALAWWRDLIQLSRKYPSLYADISAWQLVALDNAPQFKYILRKVMDGMGSDHILFGTDGPTFDPFLSKKDYGNLIKNLSQENGSPHFFKEEITAILKYNACELLKKEQHNRKN